jgi:hypothetical protein
MTAYICLTFTGTSLTPLGPTMNIYSNVDNYSSIIETAPLSGLTGDSCPYLVTNVPDGTETIRLTDPLSSCCIDIPFSDGFNLCDICDPLGFDGDTNPNVGSISVGNLTGSCDSNITDYYLEWYGPGTGSTILVATSGNGSTPSSGPYSYTHPLTGDSKIYLYPGEYRPVIRQMNINGGMFSYQYGAYGDCFKNSPLVVLPYTISNGSAAPEPYQHCIELNSNGTQPSTGLVQLSATTKYVPFRFDGGDQADLLSVYFSGTSYPTPILIESIAIGYQAGTTLLNTEFDMTSSNINYKTFGDSGTFTKVLCLTGLTRSANDVLLFDIRPQGLQPRDFTFCFTQLSTFDCEMCALTEPYYKIITNTVSAITGNCGATQVTFNVSGCSSSVDVNEDLYKYIFSGSSSALVNDAYGSVSKTINLTTTGPIGCNTQNFNYLGTIPPECFLGNFTSNINLPYQNTSNGTTRTIKIAAKSDGGGPGNPWWQYQETILASFNSTRSQAVSLGFIGFNPLLLNYWSTMTLWLPRLERNFFRNFFFSPVCWDNSQDFAYNSSLNAYEPIQRTNDVPFHFAANSVNLTLNNSGLYRILTITGANLAANPTTTIIPSEYPTSPCIDGTCNTIGDNVFTNVKNFISNSINDTTYNTTDIDFELSITGDTYNKFAYNLNPWSFSVINEVSTASVTAATTYNKISMYQYENKTFPLTGTSGNYGVRVAQTATTCPNLLTYTFDENSGTTTLNNYVRYNYLYNVTYIDNADNTKYQLLATPILSNGQPNTTTPQILVGSGTTNPSNFTVIDGAYFIP